MISMWVVISRKRYPRNFFKDAVLADNPFRRETGKIVQKEQEKIVTHRKAMVAKQLRIVNFRKDFLRFCASKFLKGIKAKQRQERFEEMERELQKVKKIVQGRAIQGTTTSVGGIQEGD